MLEIGHTHIHLSGNLFDIIRTILAGQDFCRSAVNAVR